ncbi:alpha/beta-hydrolase [Cubamyces menziesii]|uniref:Dienelactone hydrolase domain-containing protein n=1 Tax=Trametes cubensis TaxID=1111947 RepID=A0AAD7U3B2_9APHY|nr:alpha/beta-hydrolase [Cubamyces menziesii]KAJ8495102.1 hypothetical protein ONZ51_g1919 [Trametes cubensis]
MAAAVLAGPPGECCTKTVQHVGDPRGTIERIAGVETYIASPPSGTTEDKIILFFADIFGPLYVNSQLLMDYWADNGYLVLGIDYLERESYADHVNKEGFDMLGWIQLKRVRAAELLPPWVEGIRARYGVNKKYFCVGYCFAAPFVMEHIKKDWIVAGAFAHPAYLDEDHFRGVRKPLLMACAEIDITFPRSARRRVEDILVEEKAQYYIQVFSAVEHGFAVRGDPSIPIQRWAKEECARGILNWFNHWCA